MTKPSRILIADDEAKIRRVMAMLLRDEGYEVVTVGDGAAAVREAEQFQPDLVLLDQQMPEMTGLEALKTIRQLTPAAVIIIITAHGSIALAVNAIKVGAYDFIEKPFDNDSLLATVRRAIDFGRRSVELNPSNRTVVEPKYDKIVGSSFKLQQVVAQVQKVAATSATVLILGESGVGKELIARAVHRLSPRSDKRLVTLNCGAIPLSLVESELFGHEKGAFTDAKEVHEGVFEQANGGTLFLDEIAELPVEAQVKLLRVIETRTVTRLGGKRTIAVDIRIVAATNRNLEERVRQGLFRLDLLYRLNVFTVTIPPLRERREDIPALTAHFISKYNSTLGVNIIGVTPQALRQMIRYEWPGNIRDLENAVQSAMILSQDGMIDIEQLPARITGDMVLYDPSLSTDGGTSLIRKTGSTAERALIEETLRRCDYNRTLTAEALKISRKTLFNKMKKYGL
jgi:DNA-binding NtrC family response regulator